MDFSHGTVADCPCGGCGDRYVGCHSECDAYKLYSEGVAQARQQRKKKNDLKYLFKNPRKWRTYTK